MKKESIRENDLVGTLFVPDSEDSLPGIIVLPGSAAGIPEMLGEKFAREGYVVLALAYFGLEKLPQYLENIHLEYFQQAIDWLNRQSQVKRNHIALIGNSRGGELALLLGSMFPSLLKTIVAYVPSSVVCGGFPHPNTPAWLYNNKPIVPFLSGLMSGTENFTELDDLAMACHSGTIPFHQNTEDDPYIICDLFLARNQQDNILTSAAIPVEKINCPLLVITGEDDAIWPSNIYGKLIMERLENNNSQIIKKHLNYANAGHGIAEPYEGPIYHPVGKFWCKLGGTPEGNAAASNASWSETLQFLHDHI